MSSPFLVPDLDYAARQEQEAKERLAAARAALPARWDWASTQGFNPEINSAMLACFYAAGFREAAWEGLAYCDGTSSTQTCAGLASAMGLAARQLDCEFIERAERMAADRERALRDAEIAAAAANGKEPNAARPALDEAAALQWAKRRIWASSHMWSDLMKAAIQGGPAPEARGAREFWKERFFPERDYRGEIRESFGRTGWISLYEHVIKQRDEETLRWMLNTEAQADNKNGELLPPGYSNRNKVLSDAWTVGWGATVLAALPARFAFEPRDLDTKVCDSLILLSQSPGDAFAEQIDAVAALLNPGPHRLAGWLCALIDSCEYIGGDAAKEDDALARIRHLLALGADPSLPPQKYWREGGEDTERFAEGVDNSALHDMLKGFVGRDGHSPRRAPFCERVSEALSEARNLSRFDEKAPLGQNIGGAVRRRASLLGFALLGGQFGVARKLADLGADWRSAKNLFDSPSMPTEYPEASAFFEAMQLRELAEKSAEKARKRRVKNEPPAPAETASDASAGQAPRPSARRL